MFKSLFVCLLDYKPSFLFLFFKVQIITFLLFLRNSIILIGKIIIQISIFLLSKEYPNRERPDRKRSHGFTSGTRFFSQSAWTFFFTQFWIMSFRMYNTFKNQYDFFSFNNYLTYDILCLPISHSRPHAIAKMLL